MPYLLDLCYLLVLITISPWVAYKAWTTGKYRRGLWSKLSGATGYGVCPSLKRKRRTQRPSLTLQARTYVTSLPGHPTAWFHGVSVGEIHLLPQVVACFRERHPDWDCVISTTTDTGFDEALKCFPGLRIFYWPLDFSWAVRRSLRCINPTLLILAEVELWPNLLMAAKSLGVRVAVINARMSPRSLKRYAWLPRLARFLLHHVDLFAVQTEEYARCLRALGVDPGRVHVTGSVKYDGIPSDRRNPRTQEFRRLLGVDDGQLVWIAGSTQAPEEAIALEIFGRLQKKYPNLRLVLVPRQKERFDEVAALVKRSRHRFLRRSELNAQVANRTAVILIDTIGELGALWGLADIALVGGSLDGRRGGQNMIEPAAYGAAVIFGPHVWNFRDTAARLVEADAAIQVPDARALELVVERLLSDAQERHRLGTRAREFVLSQQGATERTMACLDRLLLAERRRVPPLSSTAWLQTR
jgi:3-deoxy-D-manno-octulosonic-acid transferase